MEVKPQALRQHIMRPRPWCTGSQPTCLFEEVAKAFAQFLGTFGKELGLTVAANPFKLWGTQFILGNLPPALGHVRYHGTHLCSVPAIVRSGLQPLCCERKGAQRVMFGQCAFTCAEFESADRWSQYVDVRNFVESPGPTGWFANAVVIVRGPVGESFAGCASFEALEALCVLVSLKMEWEIEALPAFISPHHGIFKP